MQLQNICASFIVIIIFYAPVSVHEDLEITNKENN